MPDSQTSPEFQRCPTCGAAMPAEAPQGLCPKCLFAGLAVPTGPEEVALPCQPLHRPEELAPHFPQLEILECLGRGGMGVVYKARQKSLNRFVALKLLAPERVNDSQFAGRFTREAQALAALSHPNIVTIYDFGQAGGFYFLLMEFVDGVNLRQAMKARRFTPEQALSVVPPVCGALQYAHDHGIVHRDIKPENLLLDKEGRVKIADFGIAKMLGDEAAAAGADGASSSSAPDGGTLASVAGTPQYMAPEQKAYGRTDHRTDIYSLGVVLYELLTGELPADKLQPPSRKVQIDVRLDEIVLRALERTPELRYQTAGEFRTQVQTMVGKVPAFTVSQETSRGLNIPGTAVFGMAIFWFGVVGVAIALVNRSASGVSFFVGCLLVALAAGLLARASRPGRCVAWGAGLAALLAVVLQGQVLGPHSWHENAPVTAKASMATPLQALYAYEFSPVVVCEISSREVGGFRLETGEFIRYLSQSAANNAPWINWEWQDESAIDVLADYGDFSRPPRVGFAGGAIAKVSKEAWKQTPAEVIEKFLEKYTPATAKMPRPDKRLGVYRSIPEMLNATALLELEMGRRRSMDTGEGGADTTWLFRLRRGGLGLLKISRGSNPQDIEVQSKFFRRAEITESAAPRVSLPAQKTNGDSDASATAKASQEAEHVQKLAKEMESRVLNFEAPIELMNVVIYSGGRINWRIKDHLGTAENMHFDVETQRIFAGPFALAPGTPAASRVVELLKGWLSQSLSETAGQALLTRNWVEVDKSEDQHRRILQLVERIEGREPAERASGGLQVRLRATKQAWKSGEAPVFTVDLRNPGKEPIAYNGLQPADFWVEVDGQWYGREGQEVHAYTVPQTLAPGGEASTSNAIDLTDDWYRWPAPDQPQPPAYGGGSKWGESLKLSSGSHVVRVKFRADKYIPISSIKNISHPVTIEIESPAVPVALDQEWRALENKVSDLRLQMELIQKLKPEELPQALRMMNMEDPAVTKVVDLLQKHRLEQEGLLASGVPESDPRSRALTAQLNALRAQLQTSLDGLRSGLANKFLMESKKLADLKRAAVESKKSVVQEP